MFARTKRLTLRHGWPEDAPALARAIGHEEVVTKLSRAPWPYTLGDADQFLAQPRGERDAIFLILAHDGNGATPELIGGIGVHLDGGIHELGYWLTPAAWGRGYATEAGRAVLHAARHALGLRHIRAGHFTDNPASGRVLVKLGFRPTGETRTLFSRARRRDTASVMYALDLAEEPAAGMPLAA